MTLGLKFFCCSKMAVTRRRSKLWRRTAHQSKALVELLRSRVSKPDLKHFGTFFRIFACNLGFADTQCSLLAKTPKSRFFFRFFSGSLGTGFFPVFVQAQSPFPPQWPTACCKLSGTLFCTPHQHCIKTTGFIPVFSMSQICGFHRQGVHQC